MWGVLFVVFAFFRNRSSVFSGCVDTFHDKEVDGYCWKDVNVDMDWFEAEKFCSEYPTEGVELFGHLATFSSLDQEMEVLNVLGVGGMNEYWIGYHTIFTWMDDFHLASPDGTIIDKFNDEQYSKFHHAFVDIIYPNATCTLIDFKLNAEWTFDFCDAHRRRFICKYPEPDSIEYLDNRPNKWDYVYDYEVTYYYRRAKCDFRNNRCWDQFRYCHGKRYDEPEVCGGKGICQFMDNCECDRGWNGPNCAYADCFGSFGIYACSARGLCKDANNCVCNQPLKYFGDQCELTKCRDVDSNDVSTCSGHGRCYEYDKCECDSGFFGDFCEVYKCNGILSNDSRICGGKTRGWCHHKLFQCDCTDHYLGKDCLTTSCSGILSNDPNVCGGRGECLDYNQCTCDNQEYTGNTCAFPMCFGKSSFQKDVCSSHGTCVSFDECECEYSYGGADCSFRTCFGIGGEKSCSGHGKCIISQVGSSCQCEKGYEGEECEIVPCHGVYSTNKTSCSGNGVCNWIDTCECDADLWDGTICDVSKCYGLRSDDVDVCSGKGKCLNSHVCLCHSVFFTEGMNCQDDVITNIFSVRLPWIGIGVAVFFFMTICISCFLFFNVRWITNVGGENAIVSNVWSFVFGTKLFKSIFPYLTEVKKGITGFKVDFKHFETKVDGDDDSSSSSSSSSSSRTTSDSALSRSRDSSYHSSSDDSEEDEDEVVQVTFKKKKRKDRY